MEQMSVFKAHKLSVHAIMVDTFPAAFKLLIKLTFIYKI